MSLVAGVDTSTQSCTVEIYDTTSASLRGRGRAPHPPTTPPCSEHDPETWWSAFAEALALACVDAGVDPLELDALSVAGQGHGLVVLDDQNHPIRPAKLWNDTTSAAQAESLVREFGPQFWAKKVGTVPTAAFTVTKLAWLADNEPDALARTRSILLPADFLAFRLTGRRVTDRSNASGTGYYSATEQMWLIDVLRHGVRDDIDWPGLLPDVLGPEQAAGTVHAEATEKLGLRPDVVVAPGMGDQHAGFIGLGLGVSDVLYSIGTSGVVMTTSDVPTHDATGRVDGVCDGTGRYLPLVSTLNSTKVSDTFTRLLNVDHQEFAQLALSAPVTPDRPIMAAFLDGERTPNRPGASGILAGFTNDLSTQQLALAAIEGVLLGLLEGQDAIEDCGVNIAGRLAITGGGSRSPAYRQLLADHLQRPVVRLDADESVARGAAIQAAAVLEQRSITNTRDAWAPDMLDETSPRANDAHAVRDRYRTLAEWDALDR